MYLFTPFFIRKGSKEEIKIGVEITFPKHLLNLPALEQKSWLALKHCFDSESVVFVLKKDRGLKSSSNSDANSGFSKCAISLAILD